MISKSHVFAAILAGSIVCSGAGAQVRNAASSVRLSTAHIRPNVARATTPSSGGSSTNGAHARQQPSVIQIPPSGRMFTGFATPSDAISFDGVSDVPGLGFDFPHLAAIAKAQGRSTDFGHNGPGSQGFFVPIFFGGYPYYANDLGLDPSEQPYGPQPESQPEREAQPQPQIIVIQQPMPAQQVAVTGSDSGNRLASAQVSEAEAPVPDIGDFIFVRRDGHILFASLFSVVGAQLMYVTPEGIRRTLALSDLDSDATQQMNDARGSTVQIHN